MIDLPDPLSSSLRLTSVPAPRIALGGGGSALELDHVIGSGGRTVLPENARGLRVTIAFTDATRHAPDELLVGALVRELERRGVARTDITLIAATGLHRPMTAGEIEAKLGADLARSLRVVNHNAFDGAGLVNLGDIDGMPVEVNRLCVECDLLLATGIVEPHQYAGWSGGAKTVVIGCGGERTIAATHAIATLDRPGVLLGAIAANPFQQFIRCAGALIGMDAAVNAIVEDGVMVDAAFGAPNTVHDLLIGRACLSVWAEVEHRAHIAVAGVPKEKRVNLYQASRAATYLALVAHPPLRSGAPIILPADIPEGVGEGAGEERFGAILSAARSPSELIERARRDGLPAGAQRAYMVARVLEHHPIIVAGGGDVGTIERCHMHHAPTLSAALLLAEQMVREQQPSAPATLDLLVVEDAIATLVAAG